jgi:RimJ/RimL family protein N-acetyltransferase
VLDRVASDAMLARLVDRWEQDGYGRAAVVDASTGQLLGFVGLGPHPAVPGEVEIGWRLVRHAWGRGLATEAATVLRDHAFDDLRLLRLVSVAVPENTASLAVMRRIGLRPWRELPYDGLLLTVHSMRGGDPRP